MRATQTANATITRRPTDRVCRLASSVRAGHAEGLEREREVRCRLKSSLRSLFETSPHHAFERRRDSSTGHWQIHGLAVQDGRLCVRVRITAERPRAGEHLVEHDADRKEVRTRVQRLTTHLLGRHVGHGAENRSGIRGVVERAVVRWRSARRRIDFRKTEVEDLEVPVRSEHHVLGFYIPVDDPFSVRCGKPACDSAAPFDGLARADWSSIHPLAQCRPVQQFFDEVQDFPGHANVVDREDVRVIQ